MAHYALINNENIVVQVITGVDETVTQLDNGVEVGGSTEAWEQFYESQPWHSGLTCKRTSFNGNIRKQCAVIRGVYDSVNDVFIRPQPYPSWILDSNFDWQPPTPKPVGCFRWDEQGLIWVELTCPFPSWTWNNDENVWYPPVPYPGDGNIYNWNESTQSWNIVQ